MATRARRRRGGQHTLAWAGTAVLGAAVLFAVVNADGGLTSDEIPPTMIEAYVGAAQRLPDIAPGCEGLTWPVLAGIGRVESNHAQGSEIDAAGDTDPWILGPRLDGTGAGGNTTRIEDTDRGRWDLEEDIDRAAGPMQFIPTSWELYGQDADGDGEADPHNIHDAALGAAVHLCGFTPVDLSDRGELRRAVLRYNQSGRYADDVLRWAGRYAERYGTDPDGPPTD